MRITVHENGYVMETPRYLSHEDVKDINTLFETLSPNTPSLTHEQLNSKLVCGSHLTLLVIREPVENRVVGMTSFIRIERLSRVCGRIEDVVVHEAHRRKGLARFLVAYAISLAKTAQMKHVDLSSGVRRVEAHRLYASLGFKLRDASTAWRIRFY